MCCLNNKIDREKLPRRPQRRLNRSGIGDGERIVRRGCLVSSSLDGNVENCAVGPTAVTALG